MSFVNIEGTHVNTDLIQTFFWEENELIVHVLGYLKPLAWEDPKQAIYRKLCRQLGVRPCEEVAENEK